MHPVLNIGNLAQRISFFIPFDSNRIIELNDLLEKRLDHLQYAAENRKNQKERGDSSVNGSMKKAVSINHGCLFESPH